MTLASRARETPGPHAAIYEWYAHPVATPDSPMLSDSQLATLADVGDEAHGRCRRPALPRRRSAVPVHRDHRRRGRDRRRRRPGDHPPRPVEVPRRAEPALGTDRLRHRGRHPALALHRRRPRRDARAAVRRRAAERPRPVHIHRQARGAPDGGGPGPADRWPALVRGDDADARLRAQQPPAVQLAGRAACGGRSAPRAPARWRGAAGALAGAGVARDRDRRERAAKRSTCWS